MPIEAKNLKAPLSVSAPIEGKVIGETVEATATATIETPTLAPVAPAKGKAGNMLAVKGAEIISAGTYTDVMHTKSADVEILALLVRSAVKSKQRVAAVQKDEKGNAVDNLKPCYETAGFRVKVIKPTKFPTIPLTKTIAVEGVDFKSIVWEEKKAGEIVDLTIWEYLYLVIQPTFGGYLSYKGDPKGFSLQTKFQDFLAKKVKLPTPSPRLTAGGSLKSAGIPIDEKKEGAERFTVKEEFLPKFQMYNETSKVSRAKGGSAPKKKVDRTSAVALALFTELCGN